MSDEPIRGRIKPGDRVKLRCGAMLEAAEDDGPNCGLFLSGVYLPQWTTAGRWSVVRETGLDIVEILPRPPTADERLAKIADLVASRGQRADVLSAIMALAAPLAPPAPPAPPDPLRPVTVAEWESAMQLRSPSVTSLDCINSILRARVAEAKVAREGVAATPEKG